MLRLCSAPADDRAKPVCEALARDASAWRPHVAGTAAALEQHATLGPFFAASVYSHDPAVHAQLFPNLADAQAAFPLLRAQTRGVVDRLHALVLAFLYDTVGWLVGWLVGCTGIVCVRRR